MPNPRDVTMGTGQEALRRELVRVNKLIEQVVARDHELEEENERLRALYQATLARNVVLSRKLRKD